MISKLLLWTVAIFAVSMGHCEALRVLGLFPHPGLSHFHFFHPIMRGLADAGHDVTVVSYFPDPKAPVNYKDLSLGNMDMLTNSVDLKMFSKRYSFNHFIEFFLLHSWGTTACEFALNSTTMQTLLKSQQKYDVILAEQFNSDCMMAVAWKLQAPVIGLSSCLMMPWHYDRVGQPSLPSYVPSLMMGYSDQMTYTERLANWITVTATKWLYNFVTLRKNEAIVREYIKDENMPHLRELTKQTSMIFVNSHYSFTGVKPNSPAVIELGGIHIKEAKPLDSELQDLLDSAKHGVVYVSWGSMIRAESLPIEKRTSLLKAFSSFKQTFVWKWENETLPNQPKNVHIRKWLPQRDILCHPNVRAFISHGGLMGSSESAYCGKPMVLTPMYGDQFLNAAAAKARGMGFIVPYEDITEESMKGAISSALTAKARENAKTVSYSYTHRPKPAVETAVWWTEYVGLTKGAPLLQSHMTNMSAFEYHLIDVYLTIAIVLAFVLFSWLYLIKKVVQRVSKKTKTKAD